MKMLFVVTVFCPFHVGSRFFVSAFSIAIYCQTPEYNGHPREFGNWPLNPLYCIAHPLVRRHNSKIRANCALFDTSMKFGTLIVDTKTSIFRYNAKPELRRFSWKP